MNILQITVSASILCLSAAFAPALAQRTSIGSGDQLPDIQCTQTRCSLNYNSAPAPASRPTEEFTTPAVVAPPAGQRYLWHGAGYPSCQSIIGVSPSAPYAYILAEDIPVPLGSTHAALLAGMQANLQREGGGNAAVVGFLQIKRSTASNWTNVSNSYAYTIVGQTPAQNLFNRATYNGLVDLAGLPEGSGIPSTIDVRLATFPLKTGTGDVLRSAVCEGVLQVTF